MRWTAKEDEKLIQLRDQGFTNQEIALRLKRTEAAVKLRASALKPKNRRWTREEVEIALNLRGEGKPTKYIAKVLDRTINAIRAKLRELDNLL